MILNHESLSDTLANPKILCNTSNSPRRFNGSDRDPELPAPDPTRIIGKLDVSGGCNTISHGEVQFSGEQWAASGTLLDQVPIEFVGGGPRVREVSVENDELELERVGEAGPDHVVAVFLHEKHADGVAVGVDDLASGEYGKAEVFAEH